MSSTSDAALAILAGGEGSRMGQPKALLRVDGRPILEYLLDRFAWAGPVWLITAPGRERPPGWRGFDRELVDPAPALGPLRGILTALEGRPPREIVIATVDMPGVRSAVLNWLLTQLRSRPGILGVMCRRENGQVEPFPMALRQNAGPLIRNRFEANKRSARGLIEEPGFIAVDCPADWPPATWLNLNEPADLQRFEA